MRKLTLFIPSDNIIEVAEKIIESGLENSIVSTTEDDEIEVELRYEKGEEDAADEVESFLTELQKEDE